MRLGTCTGYDCAVVCNLSGYGSCNMHPFPGAFHPFSLCLRANPQVAVKLLLGEAAAGNAPALAGQALSDSNPVMQNLRQVCSGVCLCWK